MSSLVSLESCIYPIKKSIRFEVEGIVSLGDGYRFSKPIKVGKTEWCLFATMECSNRTNDVTCLGVYVMNLNCFDKRNTVDVQWTVCLKHKISSKSVTRVTGEHCDKNYKNVYPCWGWIGFIEKNELVNEGYDENGIITFDCDIAIFCEKEFNNENLRATLPVAEFEPKVEMFDAEFEISQISSSIIYSSVFYIDGLPCKIGVEKEDNGKLGVYFICNPDDKSEWWQVEAAVKLRMKRREKSAKYLSGFFIPKLFSTENCWFKDCFDWHRISNLENGYVEYGRICLEVIVFIRNKYGFEERTGKGIEKPMKKITDAKITVEGTGFRVSRMILSHQSSWFSELFSNDPDKSEFTFLKLREDLFSIFFSLVYNKPFWIKESDIPSLLELLVKFRAEECIDRFDFQIADMTIADDICMLKLIDKYRLPNLRAKYVKKYQNENELRNLLRDRDVVKLSDELREDLTLDEIPKKEVDDEKPFYVYSTEKTKHAMTPDRDGKLAKNREAKSLPINNLINFFEQNASSKKLLENPVNQNVSKFSSDVGSNACQVSYKEFSDPSDMVTINFKDNKIFYSSKQILANASEYFMKKYFGPDAKDDDNTLIFDNITSEEFNILMNHIYHPTIPITESNLVILLPSAYYFSVADVLTKCENYVIKTEKVTVDERENIANLFNMEYLYSACNNYKEKEGSPK